jgi:CRP/FNR family transcriptional regulator, cyclic AMP receptor protein
MKAVHETASLPLFHGELWLARLRRSVPASRRTLHPGHVLAHPGQPLRSVYVVMSGAVALASTSQSGKRAILALVGPGGVFGQESVLRARGFSTGSGVSVGADTPALEVRTQSPCVTLVFAPRQLAAALEDEPLIALWLASSLSARARALERALARTLSFPLGQRLLELLRELAETHGRRSAEGVRVQVPLSQEDLAAMVGATRESVNRSLRELGDAGMVHRVPDGTYVLLPPQPAQAGEPGVS